MLTLHTIRYSPFHGKIGAPSWLSALRYKIFKLLHPHYYERRLP